MTGENGGVRTATVANRRIHGTRTMRDQIGPDRTTPCWTTSGRDSMLDQLGPRLARLDHLRPRLTRLNQMGRSSLAISGGDTGPRRPPGLIPRSDGSRRPPGLIPRSDGSESELVGTPGPATERHGDRTCTLYNFT